MLLLSGCAGSPPEPPTFDAARSYDYLVQQVEFGPRVPGSEAAADCRAWYYDHFSQLGLEVDSQPFVYLDPYSGNNLNMVNVIVSIRRPEQEDQRGILLLAHYDSRPRTDYATDPALKDQPIDGANDGASGVAVLMELANLLVETPPPGNVDLVLVDGEDWGKVGDLQNYMLGSREFARRGIRDRYMFCLVIDMIGDADQQIYREVLSDTYHQGLNDMVWGVAARLGVTTFRDSVKYHIYDDHLEINGAGVPAIDIIDFDYPYWHTEFDTPDKCSPEALDNVGRVLLEIIYKPSLWPKS